MKWICLIALCSSPAWPQAASNDGDSAGVAFLNYIHVVNNLDKTLAFYHDVFELDGEAQLLPNPGISEPWHPGSGEFSRSASATRCAPSPEHELRF